MSGALSASPTPAEIGDYSIIVTASDGSLTKVSNTFNLLIKDLDVAGTSGDDVINVSGNNDQQVYAGDGDDHVTANYKSDVYGGNGNDTVIVYRGEAYGEEGNDILNGTNSQETLIGGAGADTLTGSGGYDYFVYNAASESTVAEQDVITDYTGSDGDIIQLNGADFAAIDGIIAGAPTATKIGYSYDGSDVTLTAANGWSLKLANTAEAALWINDVYYGGPANDTIDALYRDTAYGGDGDDVITISRARAYGEGGNDILQHDGTNRADTLIGGAGADTLSGGSGSDNFEYNAASESTAASMDIITDYSGVGKDEIILNGADFSTIDGIINGGPTATKVGYSYDGTHVTLTAANGWQIKLENTIEAAITIGKKVYGGANGDTIYGGYDYDVWGGTGNDVIYGERGEIFGEEGDDILYGSLVQSRNDYLTGGAGADTLTGGSRNDDFIYNAASESTAVSMDVITDFSSVDGDRIVLNGGDFSAYDGIVTGAPTASKVGYSYDGTHVTLTAANGWTVKVENTDQVVVEIGNYLLGGGGNDTINGHHNDVIYGGGGNDVLNGTGGRDTISGGAGQDTMASGGDVDVFVFETLTDSTDAARDIITDYDDARDSFDLSALGLAGFGSLSITLDTGNTIVADTGSTFSFLITGDFTGVLDAGDFIF